MKRFFILALLFAPAAAYADEGGAAASLGWVAIGAGALGTVPFMLYVRVKKLSVATLGGGDAITRDLSLQHRPILNAHIALNLIGFAAGAAHGVALIRGLDAISLSLAVVMTVLTASGIVLRFSSRNARVFAKVLHTQIAMSALLVVLIALHVLAMT
ncbi:MAG: hypothetical protein QXJ74_08435 [Nitrososphaera sp.]|uniref:hypothetical protein n=1 Tax=Nitrososphaera sp. TaxID=1971748 RepID=UPI00180F1B7C|nr:hypothetical protein [Nitrososphaera sp.]NWG38000.1 hypothetical protein [Nitrososphaera sp.]